MVDNDGLLYLHLNTYARCLQDQGHLHKGLLTCSTDYLSHSSGKLLPQGQEGSQMGLRCSTSALPSRHNMLSGLN